MANLTGGAERVSLGSDYTLVAPGLKGTARLIDGGGADVRAAEESSDLLDRVLAEAEMRSVKTVEIRATPVPGTTGDDRGAFDVRDANGDDAILLSIPDLGPEVGEVVMSVDEAGAVSWHFATDDGGVQAPSSRGAGGQRRFYIRRHVPSTPPADGADRALFGAVGRKLLKVIVYPITDTLVGKPARAIAEHWESANRAYGLRRFGPDDYRLPTKEKADRARHALTADEAKRLGQGRALLFLHGTFSTANGAFHDMPPELVKDLHARYGGRVFAFDHFSLSHDPKKNIERFLQMLGELSPDGDIEVDVVSHSRGGLVARTLADGKDAFGIPTERVKVRRAVFVGVPNRGTALAQPDHVVHMIDRLTTGLNLVPPGGIADVLEGILIGVKIIGHGALKALDGLASMNPDGDFLKKLNAPRAPNAEYYAVAANYQPADEALKSLVGRAKGTAANFLADRVFETAENDLVVPESGVYERNGCEGFPIGTERCLRLPATAGVMHTGMFGNPEVARRMSEWLQ